MIFVSHAWIDNKPDKKVLQLVSTLRVLGYEACCDDMVMEERNSINFRRMMAENMQKADKVIIILSDQYKLKADSFIGGVGSEYQYILGDIDKKVKKYILATFENFNMLDTITPEFLRDRQVIFLETEGIEKLLYRIENIHEHRYPDINPVKTKLVPKNIPVLSNLLINERYAVRHPTLELLNTNKYRYLGGQIFYFSHTKDASKCNTPIWLTFKNQSDFIITDIQILNFKFYDLTLDDLIDFGQKIKVGFLSKKRTYTMLMVADIGDKINKASSDSSNIRMLNTIEGYIKLLINASNGVRVSETIYFTYIDEENIIVDKYEFESMD